MFTEDFGVNVILDGICVMDVVLVLFSIAILVLVVDFDLIARSSYLVKQWLYKNSFRAS